MICNCLSRQDPKFASRSPTVLAFRTKRETNRTMAHPGGAGMTNEQLQLRYLGTGHADLSKYEWLTNQHRDTAASIIGHYDQLSYYAVAQNLSVHRVRLQMIDTMFQPCGPPPPTKDVDKILEHKRMELEEEQEAKGPEKPSNEGS